MQKAFKGQIFSLGKLAEFGGSYFMLVWIMSFNIEGISTT